MIVRLLEQEQLSAFVRMCPALQFSKAIVLFFGTELSTAILMAKEDVTKLIDWKYKIHCKEVYSCILQLFGAQEGI